MIEQLKLLSLTAILTLLIWTSADRLVNETATVEVIIEPFANTAENDLIVRPESASGVFELQLAGPRRNIEAAQAATPMKLRVPVADRTSGRAKIALERDVMKQQLARLSPDFRKLTVVSIQPGELSVVVDRIVQKDVELTLARLNLSYEEKPVLQPSRVAVRIRESRLDELAKSGNWQALDISTELERLLKDKPAREPVTVLVPLDARQFGHDAEVIPKLIEVTATVQAARTIAEIPAVPIRLAISFGNLQRGYRVATPDGTPLTLVTQTISVTGGTEDVGRLVRGETRAFGLIQLKDVDFEELNSVKSVTPEFQLPKGIELASKPEPVEFKLVPNHQ